MNLSHWLARSAALDPERPALFAGRQLVADYGAFAGQARQIAGWLRVQGIAPGDRIAIFMKNVPNYLSVLYGIWMMGGVAVPINAKLHGREAAFILENAEAKIVFVSSELADLLSGLTSVKLVTIDAEHWVQEFATADPVQRIVDRSADDLAWLFYTSGTTGQPKGVMITHGMLQSMALSYGVDVDSVSPMDAALYAAPLSHGAGLYSLMHVQAGARHVFPPSGGFDVDEILDLAEHFAAVHMFAAPTMVKRLTAGAKAAGSRGAGLRTVVYAGGPMYLADILEATDWFGPKFVQIYGQGECPMGITALSRGDVMNRDHPEWRNRLSSVGRAQAGVEVQIAGPDGAVLGPGRQGEIIVRGPTVMQGYWRNSAASVRALRDGWLWTGDIGILDHAGFLTLKDRSKDVIITGGSNVYPREVEEVLLMHDDLHEVSVVGHAHPEWGEEVVAFVVGEASELELDQLCLENIARFKRPKKYIRLTCLPKNNYGKVLKTELRSLL